MITTKKIIIASITTLSLMSACQANNNDSVRTMITTPELKASAESNKLPLNTENNASTEIIKYDEHYLKRGELEATFTTKFNAANKARSTNISLASEHINGVVINPGEIFSYNNTLGPTNKANGYKLAKILVKGKEKKGYGGGVCQVSSTLFNAVKNAGMEIVERHAHSKPVLYVKEGEDAATSYGAIDFKFKNTKNYPVEISSKVDGGTLSVSLVALETVLL